jgi:hypothetical protein
MTKLLYINLTSGKLFSGNSSVYIDTGKVLANTNNWIIGDAQPDNSLGVDGNYYYDRLIGGIYGPKEGGDWYIHFNDMKCATDKWTFSFNVDGGRANSIYSKV